MKVEGIRPTDIRTVRARGPQGTAGGFSLDVPAEAKAVTQVSGNTPVSSVDALIALQEVPDPTTGRARAARRGRDVLDLLDDVRDGLLEGRVSRATLEKLLALVSQKREDFIDPGLAGVLDEIELRARVELAKLNYGTDG